MEKVLTRKRGGGVTSARVHRGTEAGTASATRKGAVTGALVTPLASPVPSAKVWPSSVSHTKNANPAHLIGRRT